MLPVVEFVGEQGKVGNLFLGDILLGHRTDSGHALDMAMGYPQYGEDLCGTQPDMVVYLAVFRQQADRLQGMDVPERHPAVCFGSLVRDDGHLCGYHGDRATHIVADGSCGDAVVLYYLVMRIAGAAILKECMGFLKHKLGK